MIYSNMPAVVQWTKNTIGISNRNNIIEKLGYLRNFTWTSLTINDISYTDFADYSVIVRNDVFLRIFWFSLNMTEGPTTKIEIIDLQQREVKCISVGHPKPAIFWYLRPCLDELCLTDQYTNETQRLNETTRRENGVQINSFLKLNSSWAGLLICFSNNSLGQHQSVEKISGNIFAPPITDIEISDLELKEIKCTSIGYPKPTVFWNFRPCLHKLCLPDEYKNETIALSETSKGEESDVQITSFLTLNSSWSGLLTCFSINSVGEDQSDEKITGREENLDVIGYNMKHSDEGIRILETEVGENVTFVCVSPDVTFLDLDWYFNQTWLEDNHNKYNLTYDHISHSKRLILTIYNVSKRDAGIYSCKDGFPGDENRNSTNVKLVVRDKEFGPTFISIGQYNNSNVKAISSENVTLECRVEGFPLPSIVWRNGNGKYLQPTKRLKFGNNNETMLLQNITSQDEGEYICLASNGKESDSRKIYLAVYDKSFSLFSPYYWILIVAVLLLFLTLALTIIKFRHDKLKLKDELKWYGIDKFESGSTENINPQLDITEQVDFLPYDKKWEVPWKNLKLGQVLGSGAFGIVMQGQLKTDESWITVAVKKVNRNSGFECLKALVSELKIMIYLGQHVNIVNLIGACTNNIARRELYILVEYCRFGNIQQYLLRHRNTFVSHLHPETSQCLQEFSVGSDCQENSESDMTEQPDAKLSSNCLCTKDLIRWAFQIAKGMEYLASRKIVHGDLAARNILLADDDVAKICDFGLSRRLYYDDVYKKRNSGPLPVKWMAIETILHKVFSTQSDIWSFGIVLWELFSLAMTPYPTLELDESFVNRISEGYRMECPEFAPEEIYGIMLQCWQKNPLMRPSFINLAERICSMLDETERNHYLEMNDIYMQMNKQVLENTDHNYLTMMKSATFQNNKLNRHCYVNSPQSQEEEDTYV